jgi:hypothetical protein
MNVFGQLRISQVNAIRGELDKNFMEKGAKLMSNSHDCEGVDAAQKVGALD